MFEIPKPHLHLVSVDLFEEAAPDLFCPGFEKGLALRQPCDGPDPSQINPFTKKWVTHPTRARGASHLAIPGSSLTRNVGATTRATRGTRAIKAITAAKAITAVKVTTYQARAQKAKNPSQ